ncbi:sugar transporter [Nitzschia inconspicua]|uniref:Sugar transporter n=2 Tax=Nitzschia inconspicua TaxID=303405 RepID=A0A9K3PG29_9STRA|nr:sugar transporter [Nitzschia inconspicua]
MALEALLETTKSFLPDWPGWALDVLLIMTACLLVTMVLTHFYTPDDEKTEDAMNSSSTAKAASARATLHKEFDSFRRKYIAVYLVIMLADWMQGTHMYTLYLSYNVNVSALFLTGFLSGACFAPILGSFVDKFGRKNSCIIYCVLEIIINTLEHSQDFGVLLVGRVLGGVSTNLLFSAFESWMATEHRKRGFPEEWMSRTYSEASIGNGAMAILAGIVSQLLEDQFGHIGPFQGAIALTFLALLLVLPWEENYGEKQDDADHSLSHQFVEGWKTTLSNSHIWRIGMTQALSEGAMYTFVFMWVPTMLSMNPPGGLPTGCVFSAMMMAITIGGMVYPPLQSFFSNNLVSKEKAPELCASFVYFLAAVSMAVPALCLSKGTSVRGTFELVIVSFLVVECCVGLFMPVAGTLRSKYVPDALQGAILNIFRLPLNVVVVSGTYATDVLEAPIVFKLVSGCFLAASLLQGTFLLETKPVVDSKKKD